MLTRLLALYILFIPLCILPGQEQPAVAGSGTESVSVDSHTPPPIFISRTNSKFPFHRS